MLRRIALTRTRNITIMILMKIPGCQLLARNVRSVVNLTPAIILGLALPAYSDAAEKVSRAGEAPSRRKSVITTHIRPILQANCQGCHQPAKSKGGYVMTDFKKLLAGGDSAHAAIVPRTSRSKARF